MLLEFEEKAVVQLKTTLGGERVRKQGANNKIECIL